MRAFWSRKNDEDDERYRQRTVGRIRGLATANPSVGSAEPDHIRARLDRIMREVEHEPDTGAGSV